MKNRLLISICFFLASVFPLLAQTAETDFMRSRGKIFVVVAVIVAVFAGIILFLLYLERRLTKLENQIQENEPTNSR
jgi:hypothetical protein